MDSIFFLCNSSVQNIHRRREEGAKWESKDNEDFQHKYCGGLNVNGLRRLLCSNAWSLLDKTIWEEIQDVALLEEACHWG